MTAAWILVLLVIAFVAARLFRSTRMWWILLSTIMAGLLVGMLSSEVSGSIKKDSKEKVTAQLVNTIDNISSTTYMQSLVVEGDSETTTAYPGLQVIGTELYLSDALTSNNTINGRDSPDIEDDS